MAQCGGYLGVRCYNAIKDICQSSLCLETIVTLVASWG